MRRISIRQLLTILKSLDSDQLADELEVDFGLARKLNSGDDPIKAAVFGSGIPARINISIHGGHVALLDVWDRFFKERWSS